MSYRCVVFAAVSTQLQAGDDKASIPSQIENARALIQRRGWREIAPPLIVPGQSRSIDFLHEAIEEVPAIRQLIEMAKHGEMDLVICRDYDRLSRTRTLLTQISAYLSRCNIQIYAMDKPVEPLPPDELRRQRTLYSSATVEAFAGLEAEREVGRIVERRFFGMNNVMRQGKWVHPHVAFGYTRKRIVDGQEMMLDVPEIVPEEAETVQRIDRLYLREGLGTNDLSRRLNLEKIPAPSGGRWRNTSVLHILRNPFYAGYVVWGLQRRERVYDPRKENFVKRQTYVPAYQQLKDALGYKPGLLDLLAHVEQLEADDVVIVEGEHEPLRSLDQQRRIEQELTRRYVIGGRGASARGARPHIFSGLLVCATCGGPFVIGSAGRTGRVYYRCSNRQRGGLCTEKRYVREVRLYHQVMEVLREIVQRPGAIAAYLEQTDTDRLDTLRRDAEGLRTALEEHASRRRRWDTAYESGVIDLAAYGVKLGELAEERASLEEQLAAIEINLADASDRRDRTEIIQYELQHLPPHDDYTGSKLLFRRLIDHIVIHEGKMVKLALRA